MTPTAIGVPSARHRPRVAAGGGLLGALGYRAAARADADGAGHDVRRRAVQLHVLERGRAVNPRVAAKERARVLAQGQRLVRLGAVCAVDGRGRRVRGGRVVLVGEDQFGRAISADAPQLAVGGVRFAVAVAVAVGVVAAEAAHGVDAPCGARSGVGGGRADGEDARGVEPTDDLRVPGHFAALDAP